MSAVPGVTRIDFYLLPVSEPHGKLSFACRLAEKAWQSGHQVYLHGSDAAEAEAIDALLFHYTHDILRSPAAIDRLLALARPGALVAIAGIYIPDAIVTWFRNVAAQLG